MKHNIILTAMVATLLAGCASLPLPQGVTEQDLKSVVAAKFGSDQFVTIHQVLHSGPLSALLLSAGGSSSEALALAREMSKSERGRVDLVVVCDSSSRAASEIRKALSYQSGRDWSKLNLLFVGSQSEAEQLCPLLKQAGIGRFAWYEATPGEK